MIEAINSFVAHQYHSGACRDMLVIGNIDGDLWHLTLLDPAVKHGNRVAQTRVTLRRGEEFYAEMLDIH